MTFSNPFCHRSDREKGGKSSHIAESNRVYIRTQERKKREQGSWKK